MLATVMSSRLPVEEFQSRLHQVCGLFRAEPVKGRDMLTGAILLESRAGLEMAHVAKDLQAVRRTHREIRRDSGENCFLIVQEEGRALMSQRGSTHLLQAGDMILIDSAEPSEFSFFGTFGRQLSVHLPRIEMRERLGDAVPGGLYLPRADYTALAITAVLAKAFSSTCGDEQTFYLREAIFSLIGAALCERTGGAVTPGIEADVSRARLLEQGLAYIDRCFVDGDLTIRQVAADLGVSIRQLQRAFALAGTTPKHYLLKRRLEHACKLLQARRDHRGEVLVSSIAYASGFNDISNFNRQFRRAFDCAPQKYIEAG